LSSFLSILTPEFSLISFDQSQPIATLSFSRQLASWQKEKSLHNQTF
jgi:hypothetical protein